MTPLRQRMLQDMGIRNLALNTQHAYVQQISAFARHYDCSPEALGPEQVRAYQVHLIEERKLAAGSLSVVAAALRFLYKITLRAAWNDDDIPMPKRPLKLPIVLRKDRYVMLSPRLLEVLRDYWRIERPKPWLFAGDAAGHHISKNAVEQACHKEIGRAHV